MNKNDQCKPCRKGIYFAAPLFAIKECVFNLEIANRLEASGKTVFLPQRDGFEFSKFGDLPLHGVELSKAIATIIYLRDLHHLQDSDICIANLEEPLDPGVLVEITYAKAWGIPVIGYRCESRTPFGMAGDWNAGMHFFPLFQCDHFINFTSQRVDHKEAQDQMFDDMTTQILKFVQIYIDKPHLHRIDIFDPKWYNDENGNQRNLQPSEKLLIMTKDHFGPHIPSDEVVQNYINMKDQLEHLLTQVIKFDENRYINVCGKEGIKSSDEKPKDAEILNAEDQHNKM